MNSWASLRERAFYQRQFLWITARAFRAERHVLPDFLIIGVQKAGTTSLFAYLAQHPQIVSPVLKEPGYFSRNHRRGPRWYRANFPTRTEMDATAARIGRPCLTFDASPETIYTPGAPDRVAAILGARKMIALVRDPVLRVQSAFAHNQRYGIERRSLLEAIDADLDYLARIGGYSLALRDHGVKPPFPSYLSRGLYADLLQAWIERFGRHQFLILQAETMFADPRRVFDESCAFLGLDRFDRIDFQPANVGGRQQLDTVARARLDAFYEAPNAALFERFGIDYRNRAASAA